MDTKAGRQIQHENKLAIEALSEIDDEAIMDELLENFVGEEFRVLSFQIVRNELFTSKMQGDDEDYLDKKETITSPTIS